MGKMQSSTPTWWTEEHTIGWSRIKGALRRDWAQTMQDLHMEGREIDPIPEGEARPARVAAVDRPLPPSALRQSSDWHPLEEPVGFGYAARMHYGSKHPNWSDPLDTTLRGEWDGMGPEAARAWDEVRGDVRRGYEYDDSRYREAPPASFPTEHDTRR
jgi:hypothetical protein